MLSFQVGQRVRVKSIEELHYQYKHQYETEWSGIGFVKGYMENFAGKTVTVKYASGRRIKIEEDYKGYTWSRQAFEPLNYDEYSEEEVINNRW